MATGGMRSHWGGEFDQADLCRAVEKADFIVGHNLKYEYGWLRRCGVDISRLIGFDTQIAEYVLLGNLAAGDPEHGVPRTSISLDACCIRRGLASKDPIVDIWIKNGISVADMPRAWVEGRCKQDVKSTQLLFKLQREALRRSGRVHLLYTRCLLTPVLATIETTGVHLDAERVRETTASYRGRLAELESEFAALTGGINFRSPKQVAEYIYDTLGFEEPKGRDGAPKRTPGGNRIANKRVFDSLKAKTEDQRRFLEIKRDIGHVSSALSKNLDYFQEICDERNSIFHAQLNQTVTATHRLSSTGIPEVSEKSVQLTNIPRAFKRLFNARRDGWLIGEVDGAQLEYRVAAFLGNDPRARDDISDPAFDIHILAGAEATRRPYEECYAAYKRGEEWAIALRQWAKIRTFRPLYGGSSGTPDEQRWFAAFKERYSVLADKQKDWVYEVLEHKELRTPWGLRFYFPTARLSSTGYCNVGNAVYNYPIQSLATAEIIPIAIIHFWHRVRASKFEDFIIPVNTIHDSLVCEVHPDYVEQFRDICRLSFGHDVGSYLARVYNLHFDVPLGAGIKIGTHWGSGEETKYEYSKAES